MSDTILTDGNPVPEDGSHKAIKPNGQQESYIILTKEERTKGFVKPVRTSYVHVGPLAPKYPLRDLTLEELNNYKQFGYVKYEEYPESDSAVVGMYWTQERLDRISKCGTITTIFRPLAETYARDPKFYSGTFCVNCKQHFPMEEFVWEGTDERL